MRYDTSFTGAWSITPPLSAAHRDYLKAFFDSRRQRYHEDIVAPLPDPKRAAVGLPAGPGGCYVVNDSLPPTHEALEYSCLPPLGQPDTKCEWRVTDDGRQMLADVMETRYYNAWIMYLVEHFLAPWGYSLNGVVKWKGSDRGDRGRLTFNDNVLTVEVMNGRWQRTLTWSPAVKGQTNKD